MPRVTKEVKEDELNKKKSTSKKSATTTKKKTTKAATTKASTKTKTTSTKVAKTKAKKEVVKVVDKKEVKETTSKSTTKKATTTRKSTPTDKSTSTSKKTTTRKKSATSTTTTKKKNTTTKSKKLSANIIAEYYDLPYRYNETVVKILYQTPTILFVYWDISDHDREIFIKQYGQNFFNNTRPILKVFNLTKNYDFEIEINDFANSWYINVNDANCEYKVELGRKTIKHEENLNTDYIYVSSSNDIEFPNDHILLDELPNKLRFKNVKTNIVTQKDIGTLHLIGINKVYNAHDFYKRFYKDEIIEEINSNKIINPSSSWN